MENNEEIISRITVKLDDKNRFTIPKRTIDDILINLNSKSTCRITTYKDKIVIDNFLPVRK